MTATLSTPSPAAPGGSLDVVSANRPKNHPTYFWDFIQFNVENVYFQLPKTRFVHDSNSFAERYGIPRATQENRNENQTVFELSVSLPEFECFLKVFLPDCASHQHSQAMLSTEEWVSVLKLASQWSFTALRAKAIAQLSSVSMSPISRILLARQYSIPSWLIQGYESIVLMMATTSSDQQLLSLKEAKELGLEVYFELSNLALKRLSMTSLSGSQETAAFDIRQYEPLKEELKGMVEIEGAAEMGVKGDVADGERDSAIDEQHENEDEETGSADGGSTEDVEDFTAPNLDESQPSSSVEKDAAPLPVTREVANPPFNEVADAEPTLPDYRSARTLKKYISSKHFLSATQSIEVNLGEIMKWKRALERKQLLREKRGQGELLMPVRCVVEQLNHWKTMLDNEMKELWRGPFIGTNKK